MGVRKNPTSGDKHQMRVMCFWDTPANNDEIKFLFCRFLHEQGSTMVMFDSRVKRDCLLRGLTLRADSRVNSEIFLCSFFLSFFLSF
jgi:hypothetical protein